jgi:hypothetical protein
MRRDKTKVSPFGTFFLGINRGQEIHLKFCISSSGYIVRASTTLVRRKTLGGRRERASIG